MAAYLQSLLSKVHEEVRSKYYGCGLVAPLALEGARILDLGCGSGRDAYVLAQLAGQNGEVVGVDMTPEQLAVARSHVDWHAERFGFRKPNTRFLEAYIERLEDLGLEPESFEIIVLNCVLNLSPDQNGGAEGGFKSLEAGR